MSANGETVPGSTTSEMTDVGKGKGKAVAEQPEVTMEEDDDEEDTAEEEEVRTMSHEDFCWPSLTLFLLHSNPNLKKVYEPPLHETSHFTDPSLPIRAAIFCPGHPKSNQKFN